MNQDIQKEWEIKFENEIGGGLSSNPAFKAQVKKFIKQQREEIIKEMTKEIEMNSRAKIGDDPKSTEFIFKQYGLRVAIDIIRSFV